MRRAEVRFFRIVFRLFVLILGSLTAHPEQVFGANESLPWSFAYGADGYGPVAGLTTDSNGNLYGTTASGGAFGGGTVFELSPPTTDAGSWTESILWNFSGGTDGSAPAAGLIIDGSGNLYGTTTTGGSPGAFGVGLGTVFKLNPPAISGRKWTESIIWSFGGYPADGDGPKGLALDASGNLFGTTGYGGAYNSGTAFELSPPTTGRNWTEYIIWNFGSSPTDGVNPAAGLIMDSGGNLYGTTGDGGTAGLGTAFELTPPTTSGGNWNESILWNFGNGTDGYVPLAGLTMDPSGNLYGTTAFGGMQGGGTVFGLTPPTTAGGSWNEWLLWNFGSAGDGQNPAAGLIMDSGGHLFGTTEGGGTSGGPDNGGGTVFELTPLSIGAGPWGETILWNFGSGTDGYLPVAGLVMDANGNLYGTTDYGGTYQVNYTGGTVFEISAIAAIPTPSPTPTVVSTPTPTPTVVSTPTPPPPTPTPLTPTPTPMPPPPTPTPPLPTPTPVISVTPAPTPTPLPPGPAAVTMSSRSLAFGNVAYAVAGAAARVRKLTITNPAKYKTAAIISSIVGPAGFSGDPACVNATIPPGGRLACNITYVPTGLGAVGGTLTVNDNVSGAPQFIGLSGAGIPGKLTASPGTLNFASVPLNTTSAAQIILLRNRSAVTFTISSTTNGNPGFVASKNCVGPLGPLASCAITLSYSPTVTTRETDTLTILDSPDAIARTVNLIGTGH